MPQYRRGFGRQVAATMYAKIIDGMGSGVSLKDNGTLTALFANGAIAVAQNFKLGNAKSLMDSNANVLLGSDEAGNIDALGTITEGVTYTAGGNMRAVSAAHALISGGTITTGVVRSSGSETLLFGVPVVATTFLNQANYLNGIQVAYYTSDNNAYISEIRLCAYTYGGRYVLQTYTTDYGNGSTGRDYTSNLTRNNTSMGSLVLEIDTVITAGYVDIEELLIAQRSSGT